MWWVLWLSKTIRAELLLDHLYVIPSAQGAGIGSEVLTQIFREADEIGRLSRLVLSRKALQTVFTLAMALCRRKR
jgi:GNAT superfamily N-acetyltransferase